MILCPAELSPCARAATAASWPARRYQDSLLLLHVIVHRSEA
jgi:hypothetical protein